MILKKICSDCNEIGNFIDLSKFLQEMDQIFKMAASFGLLEVQIAITILHPIGAD